MKIVLHLVNISTQLSVEINKVFTLKFHFFTQNADILPSTRKIEMICYGRVILSLLQHLRTLALDVNRMRSFLFYSHIYKLRTRREKKKKKLGRIVNNDISVKIFPFSDFSGFAKVLQLLTRISRKGNENS